MNKTAREMYAQQIQTMTMPMYKKRGETEELKQVKQSFRATEIKWQENNGGEEGLCNINYDILINRTAAGINSLELVLISLTGIEIGQKRVNNFAEYQIIAPIDFTKDIYPKEVFIDVISKKLEICL